MGREPDGGGIHGADAKDENRHVERQDQERQQHRTAPRAQREGRTDGADQRQPRTAQRQRQDENGDGGRRQAQQESQGRGGQEKGQARGEPVGDGLGEKAPLEREWGQGQLLEPAVLLLLLEQAIERRWNAFAATLLRLYGEHRIANLLTMDPEEYERIRDG